MITFKPLLVTATLALATTTFSMAALAAEDGYSTEPTASQPATATEFTKEQAIERALKAHPGTVVKAYEDTKKGKKTWEVKIKGTDGQKWEMYYDIKTGELVAEETD